MLTTIAWLNYTRQIWFSQNSSSIGESEINNDKNKSSASDDYNLKENVSYEGYVISLGALFFRTSLLQMVWWL